jgi:signal transduction histidine kinase
MSEPDDRRTAQAPILVVDDDQANLTAIQAVLAPLGQKLVPARSGEEALKQLLDHDFAVILLDISMPGIDGFQTARLIRQREKTKNIPIIFLTGIVTDPANMLKGYAQGAVDYLVKPYNVDILRSKVAVFVELYHAREELRRLAVADARRANAEAERRRFHDLLLQAPVAIGELRGPEHRFVFINPRLERMVNRKNLLGKTVVEAFPAMALGPLIQILDRVFREGDAFSVSEFETPYDRNGDGHVEPTFFSFNLEPLRDEHGTITGMMGVAVDMTDMVIARKRIEEALTARDDFISVASHELRTPMTTLRLQTESLLAGLKSGNMTTERAMPKLTLARRQLDRLDALVADLVDVTRISSGRLELHREPFDLGELCDEVAQRFSDELAKASCPLTLEIERGLVGRWDRFRLDQVLTNLLTNAMKYGAGKPVTVQVRRDGEKAEVAVRDEGVGIPPAEQSRIFERFERATSGKHHSGLGLGLWIAQKIVTASGGTLTVTSEPGKGSRFSVRLSLDDKG